MSESAQCNKQEYKQAISPPVGFETKNRKKEKKNKHNKVSDFLINTCNRPWARGGLSPWSSTTYL